MNILAPPKPDDNIPGDPTNLEVIKRACQMALHIPHYTGDDVKTFPGSERYAQFAF
jgi:hypothetical protein